MRFVVFSSEKKKEWDDFIKKSKNAHFFFQRDYIEYHGERFQDFSLMVFDDKDALVAVLPANRDGDIIYSHQGLTFGGFIVSDSMKTEVMINIFKELLLFLKSFKIKKIVYKCIPYIYHKKPAEEDRYALFLNDAKIVRRDVTSTIYLEQDVRYSKGRKWSINKAKKENVEIFESRDFASFWEILENVLGKEHKAKPVHSLQEIEMLAMSFPDNIRLFMAKHQGVNVSGALIYDNEIVAHTQYLANSDKGREVGALDLLIDRLIGKVFNGKKYFDFGISNENQGRDLNLGLIAQKEGFGARPVVHDFYEIEIK